MIDKVGTDDNPAEAKTKYIADGKKLTHMSRLGGVEMNRGLELVTLSVAAVALQGCASIVQVEGTVTGSTAAVIVRVSAAMVITVSLACSWWLVRG